MITLTDKQAQDMVTLLEQDSRYGKTVIIGFLKKQLEESIQPHKPVERVTPDWCSSDLK